MRLFSDASSAVADPFLRRAFALAENGRGTTYPNPLVGCVIVRDGEVVGEGWHERAGGPHAEVNALRAADELAVGATAYVTLEPCAHTGRTGPCTAALVDFGVSRVVIGMRDPNPSVSGAGAEVLRDAGVEVEFAEDPAPFERQNEAWIKRVTMDVPWVTCKVALSLDGHAALKPGERAQLSGPECKALTMQLRNSVDGVLVGAGTLAADDPALTVRDGADIPAARQPLRIVLSRTTVPSADAGVFRDGLGPVLVLLSGEVGEAETAALSAAGARVERYDARGGLRNALWTLGRLGLTHLLVEAGPHLLEALWRQHAIDELILYHSGGMAGATAPPLFSAATHGTEEKVMPRMQAVEAGVAGRDAVSVWQACPGFVCEMEE